MKPLPPDEEVEFIEPNNTNWSTESIQKKEKRPIWYNIAVHVGIFCTIITGLFLLNGVLNLICMGK